MLRKIIQEYKSTAYYKADNDTNKNIFENIWTIHYDIRFYQLQHLYQYK